MADSFGAAFARSFLAVKQQRFENDLALRRQQQDEAQFERQTRIAQMNMEFAKQRQEQDVQQFDLDQKKRKLEIDALTRATGMANVKDIEDMVNSLTVTTQRQKFFEDRGNTEQAQLQKFLKGQIMNRMKTAGPTMMGQPGAQAAPAQGGAPPTEEGPGVPPLQAAVPPAAEPAGAAPLAGQPAQPPAFATPAFYKHVQGIKPGTPEARFTTPEGTIIQVVDTPKEATLFNENQQRAEEQIQEMFKGDAAMFMPPHVTAVSRVEAKAKEIELNQAMRAARMEERKGKAQEEFEQTAEQENAINATMKEAKATSRIRATDQGVIVTGFNVDNMARERTAIESLAEKGQLNRTVLEAYNNSFGDAVSDALEKRPELNAVLVQTEPGEFRIRSTFPAVGDANLLPRAVNTVNDFQRLSETIEENGIPPTIRVRQSRPDEIAKDFVSSLPEGAQLMKNEGFPGREFRKPLQVPRSPASQEEVTRLVAKLNAGISRAIYDLPPDQREAALEQARTVINGVMQTHWIGQAPLERGIPMGGFTSQLLNKVLPRSERTQIKENAATDAFKSLQSILGKPKGSQPVEAPPSSFRPGLKESVTPQLDFGAYKPGKETSQASGGGGGASGVLGMSNALMMAGVMGGVQEVNSFNSAFSSVQKAKDRNAAAKSAAGDLKSAWGGMTDKEKEAARSQWVTNKTKWKQWKVDEKYINEVESFINPKKK